MKKIKKLLYINFNNLLNLDSSQKKKKIVTTDESS